MAASVLSKISCHCCCRSTGQTDRQNPNHGQLSVTVISEGRGGQRMPGGDKCPGTGGGVRLETEGGEKWKRGGGQLLCFRSFVVV